MIRTAPALPFRPSPQALLAAVLLPLLFAAGTLAHPLHLGVGEVTAEGHGIAVVPADGGWQLLRGQELQAIDLPAGALPLHLAPVTMGAADEVGTGLLLISLLPDAANENAAAPAGERFDLRMGDGSGAWQALPAPTTRGLLVTPRPLFGTGGELRQMIWIEGEDLRSTAVRTASWTGSGWGQPSTLSAIGPGTQTALSAVTLADGSFLVAWAAFDGEDDEIRWSRFDDGRWSVPAALSANAVPDVTPTLHALPDDEDGSALIAWSAFDGRDYRLRLARFTGRDWTEPSWHGGKGSVSPYFSRDGDTAILVFLQTVPAAWVVSELEASGEVRRSAATSSHVADARRAARRPMVVAVEDEGPKLRWPAVDVSKAMAVEAAASSTADSGTAGSSEGRGTPKVSGEIESPSWH